MVVDVVFHIDFDDEKLLEMALGNMKNLLREVDAEESSVCLLANGSSVKLLAAARAEKWREAVERLSGDGVRFYVCNNSLNGFGLSAEEMLPCCEVIRAGVLKLVELQKDGYAYIKP